MTQARHEPDTTCPDCGGVLRWFVDIRAGVQGYEHRDTGLASCEGETKEAKAYIQAYADECHDGDYSVVTVAEVRALAFGIEYARKLVTS